VRKDLLRFFDAPFYASTYGQAEPVGLHHFLQTGDAAGLDPNAYFSTVWYKHTYPDWRDLGASTALEDFTLRLKRNEERNPHPLIDLAYLRRTYSDFCPDGAQAYAHFITQGDAHCHQPSEIFDPLFYRDCYCLPFAQKSFEHYARIGHRLGLLTRPNPRSQDDSAAQIRSLLLGRTPTFVLAVHDAFPGGVPILCLEIARILHSRGHRLLFIMERGGALLERFQVLGPVVILKEGWSLDGVAQALPPDVPLLVSTAAAAWIVPTLCRTPRRSLVLINEMPSVLNDLDLMGPLQDAKAAGARFVVATQDMAIALRPLLGDITVKMAEAIIPTTPLSDFRGVQQHVRSLAGISDAKIFIGAGGYGTHRKGFDRFISAALLLHARCPRAMFIWLGILDEEGLNLAVKAREAGLNLHLPGFVTSALAWYHAADVYLSTSRTDIGPLPAFHAALMGTPVIAYRSDIAVSTLLDSTFKFIAENDEASFVNAALSACGSRLGRATRAQLRSLFLQDGFNAYVDALLQNISPKFDTSGLI
jgi:glycosyltransferase involved in cell wall biosynthesis